MARPLDTAGHMLHPTDTRLYDFNDGMPNVTVVQSCDGISGMQKSPERRFCDVIGDTQKRQDMRSYGGVIGGMKSTPDLRSGEDIGRMQKTRDVYDHDFREGGHRESALGSRYTSRSEERMTPPASPKKSSSISPMGRLYPICRSSPLITSRDNRSCFILIFIVFCLRVLLTSSLQ